jgi:hypothetical protein
VYRVLIAMSSVIYCIGIKNEIPRENHRPATSPRQILSHKVVSSTRRHGENRSLVTTLMQYHTIAATAPLHFSFNCTKCLLSSYSFIIMMMTRKFNLTLRGEGLWKTTDASQVTYKLLSHNVVSSTPRLCGIRTHDVSFKA